MSGSQGATSRRASKVAHPPTRDFSTRSLVGQQQQHSYRATRLQLSLHTSPALQLAPPLRPPPTLSLPLLPLVRMARNEEKSQSMLFRFREAQAAELGLSGRSDRRPRVASSCKDLRQCERWRGEILREISRKVSKIQDGALHPRSTRLAGYTS